MINGINLTHRLNVLILLGETGELEETVIASRLGYSHRRVKEVLRVMRSSRMAEYRVNQKHPMSPETERVWRISPRYQGLSEYLKAHREEAEADLLGTASAYYLEAETA